MRQHERMPASGTIELTSRCNLACVHCFINHPADDPQALANELTTAEWKNILDQIADEGCLWLLLTGGEPFIRPDFLDIYDHAKQKGFILTLFTNGTALTPRIADHLAECPPHEMEISLYSLNRETYEQITRVPGSFDQCMRGIDLLLQRKLPLTLKTPVLTLNQSDIPKIQRYADGLGLDFRFDPSLNFRLDSNPAPGQFRITPEQVVAMDLEDSKRTDEWHEFCRKYVTPPPDPDLLYQCGAGMTTFHIDSSGRLSACLMARQPSYDLRQGTFHDGWHEFLMAVRSQKYSRQTPCRSCELMSLCGQCPGWAQMENGDQEKPVEYLCRIAHLRAEAFVGKKKENHGSHG